jgi:sigma-B regulation protein RsbU (phosphoserine phosphatase)
VGETELAARKRILVIDDTTEVRRVVITYLEHLGFEVAGAEDGASGLEEVRRAAPDLVMCDLRMPRMDGLEFLAAVHALLPELPVIVMSGAGLVADAVGALKLGAWDYIEKPFAAMEVIEHAVARALERSDLLSENRRYRERLERINGELRATLRLLTDDEDAGRQIQARMLPRNHQSFGPFEFSREVVPSAYLSGDFIDAFAIDERYWAFYLADVAGHGVSSALVTVLLRTFVQRHASEHLRTRDGIVLSPARLLDRLNEEITRDDLDKHLTIFYGVVDLETSSLLYANAGHFPWPLLFDGERVVEIEQPGVPVGLMPGTRYREHRLELPPKLVFAVFSDGLLEILPHPDLAGKQAFLRSLFGRADITVEMVRKELELGDRTLPDDVAMLLIKRGGR